MTDSNNDNALPQEDHDVQRGAVHHVHNEEHAKPVLSQKEIDTQLLDIILQALYNNGNKLSLSLTKDIFDTLKIPYNQEGSERIWEILINTGFVSPVIGFGNEDKMDLTTDGYKMMTRYGSYKAYLATLEQNQNNPKIVIQANHQEQTAAKDTPKKEDNNTESDQSKRD